MKAPNHLAMALMSSNCKLLDIDLTKNKIGDEGMNYLAMALKHPYCKVVAISVDEEYKVLVKSAIQVRNAMQVLNYTSVRGHFGVTKNL